jgi:dynein heavy chain, axonemal
MSELFPGQHQLTTHSPEFTSAVKEQCDKMNLQGTTYFLDKINQIYQMILCRHGLMIVGNTLSGKTSSYNVIANALKVLKEKNLMNENQVRICLLNPKSMSTLELYGIYDLTSHEWIDGVLAANYRKFALDSTENRKWIVFDGPVDAIWIENMNSVLDDNKKLCLMSGEIIKLPERTNLIFETSDLEQASPATVSRCGMIYIEAMSLGWRPLVASSMKQLPKLIEAKHKLILNDLYDKFVEPILNFIRINKLKKFIDYTSDSHLVVSLIKLNNHLINILSQSTDLVYSDIEMHLEAIFFFSLVWSIGSSLIEESRLRFNEKLKELLENRNYNFPIDDNLTCFDLKLKIGVLVSSENAFENNDEDENKDQEEIISKNKFWETWSDELNRILKGYTIQKNSLFDEIIVPTVDKTRHSYFFNVFLNENSIKNSSILLAGVTGTGKTSYSINYILKNLSKNSFSPIIMNFSGQTTSNQTQNMIMESLVKLRKGFYGPQINKKCVSLVKKNLSLFSIILVP